MPRSAQGRADGRQVGALLHVGFERVRATLPGPCTEPWVGVGARETGRAPRRTGVACEFGRGCRSGSGEEVGAALRVQEALPGRLFFTHATVGHDYGAADSAVAGGRRLSVGRQSEPLSCRNSHPDLPMRLSCDGLALVHTRPVRLPSRSAVAVVVGTLAIAGCSHSSSVRTNVSSVVVGRGLAGGTQWKLVAGTDAEGSLCLDVFGSRGADLGEGGCGFGPAPADRDPSDYGSADLADGSSLLYGPAPLTVRRVVAHRDPHMSLPATSGPAPTGVVSSSAPQGPMSAEQCGQPGATPTVTVRVGARLPRWSRPGSWFVVHVAPNADCYEVTFLDAAGKIIPQSRF
jgi:hypothetical protein